MNTSNLKQQNIIIIGATSGIGRALFEKYVADGNRIGIVGRRTHLLDELRQEHPDTTIIATADITKQDEIAQAIDELHSELKHIDLAIVCSGMGDMNASLHRCPGIVEHLSLNAISSFLSITPQMLSKIRKDITFDTRQ